MTKATEHLGRRECGQWLEDTVPGAAKSILSSVSQHIPQNDLLAAIHSVLSMGGPGKRQEGRGREKPSFFFFGLLLPLAAVIGSWILEGGQVSAAAG